jgi:hypothetical protein
MVGPTGNPQARNLFEIVAYLQKRKTCAETGLNLRLLARDPAAIERFLHNKDCQDCGV